MEGKDYSLERGVADEENFNVIVERFGGSRVDGLIIRKGVQQADYLFREQRVVAEHKILETEFGDTPESQGKIIRILEKHSENQNLRLTNDLLFDLAGVLRAPLQRIIKKANTQIKSTKQELGLTGFEGVLFLVNDGFRGPPPSLVVSLISDIMSGKHYKSIRSVVYISNHYIELPDHPDALLWWQPLYSEYATPELVDFVNNIGRLHGDYAEEKLGKFDTREEHEFLDLGPALAVTGAQRHFQFREQDNGSKDGSR